MVVVPAGSLTMGFDGGEEGRYEGPVREMRIARSFAAGQFPVTNGEYARFSEATGREAGGPCNYYDFEKQDLIKLEGSSWRNPGHDHPIRDDEPVVCVSWTDSKAYVQWLSEETGAPYRLLSEAEWEYIASDGAETPYPWGEDPSEACAHANVPDATLKNTFGLTRSGILECSDGYAGIAPVDAFPPNGYGIYDLIGNSWEWVEDCYLMPYPEGPLDGTAVQVEGDCDRRAVRGGAWISSLFRQRPSWRGRDPEGKQTFIFGFRVARDLP
jgi:formylglycine-generating enzyme required for sulfatase activity